MCADRVRAQMEKDLDRKCVIVAVVLCRYPKAEVFSGRNPQVELNTNTIEVEVVVRAQERKNEQYSE